MQAHLLEGQEEDAASSSVADASSASVAKTEAWALGESLEEVVEDNTHQALGDALGEARREACRGHSRARCHALEAVLGEAAWEPQLAEADHNDREDDQFR